MKLIKIDKPYKKIYKATKHENIYTYWDKDIMNSFDYTKIKKEVQELFSKNKIRKQYFLNKYGVNRQLFKTDTISKNIVYNVKLHMMYNDVLEFIQEKEIEKEAMNLIIRNRIATKTDYSKYSKITRQTLDNSLNESVVYQDYNTISSIKVANNLIRTKIYTENKELLSGTEHLNNKDFFEVYLNMKLT